MKKTYINPEIEMVNVASADVITTSVDRVLGAFTVSGTGMGFGDAEDSWVW